MSYTKAIVKYTYTAASSNEYSVNAGEVVTIVIDEGEYAFCTGARGDGYIPKAILQIQHSGDNDNDFASKDDDSESPFEGMVRIHDRDVADEIKMMVANPNLRKVGPPEKKDHVKTQAEGAGNELLALMNKFKKNNAVSLSPDPIRDPEPEPAPVAPRRVSEPSPFVRPSERKVNPVFGNKPETKPAPAPEPLVFTSKQQFQKPMRPNVRNLSKPKTTVENKQKDDRKDGLSDLDMERKKLEEDRKRLIEEKQRLQEERRRLEQERAEEERRKIEEERRKIEEERKEAERRQREEAERRQRELLEQQRRQREEAERRQREEAERRQREEAEKRQREEAERRQREEAERRQRELEKRQREEAERRQREEAERRQREEAERRKREEAERKQREEAERRQREAERRQRELIEQQKRRIEEAERKQREEAERRQKEAERKLREESERRRREQAEQQKQEAERKQREWMERQKRPEADSSGLPQGWNQRVITLYACEKAHPRMLAFSRGEYLLVNSEKSLDEWYYARNVNRQEGYVPKNRCKITTL